MDSEERAAISGIVGQCIRNAMLEFAGIEIGTLRGVRTSPLIPLQTGNSLNALH
jgi:hypothetical protein